MAFVHLSSPNPALVSTQNVLLRVEREERVRCDVRNGELDSVSVRINRLRQRECRNCAAGRHVDNEVGERHRKDGRDVDRNCPLDGNVKQVPI